MISIVAVWSAGRLVVGLGIQLCTVFIITAFGIRVKRKPTSTKKRLIAETLHIKTINDAGFDGLTSLLNAGSESSPYVNR